MPCPHSNSHRTLLSTAQKLCHVSWNLALIGHASGYAHERKQLLQSEMHKDMCVLQRILHDIRFVDREGRMHLCDGSQRVLNAKAIVVMNG